MPELHSLKDVIRFTGVLTTAGLRFGQAFRAPTFKTVAAFVPSISPQALLSLKSLIGALHTLPSFDLSARIEGPTSGRPPFVAGIRVSPSSGAIIETVLNYCKDGVQLPPRIPLSLVNGTDISSGNIIGTTFNEPGHYEAVIARTGITSEGMRTLVRRLPFTVSTGPLPPPPPPLPPMPTCSVELSLDGTFGSNFVQMRVFGGGFTRKEDVQIIEKTEVLDVARADEFGLYSIKIGFLRGPLPTEHAVMAHGVQSGLNTIRAGFTV